MSFEFMYCNDWYKYDHGYIFKKGNFTSYHEQVCPVARQLNEVIDSMSTAQQHAIMIAVLHGYRRGYDVGRNDQIKDFKRLFNID
jgi:hypothetical protein